MTKTEEVKSEKPEWIKIKPAELEKIILELYKEGKTPAQIGIILRDKHGIPKAKLLGKRISEMLAEKNIIIPSEKENLSKKMKVLETHITKNKHDYCAKRSIAKKQWIMNKLEKR